MKQDETRLVENITPNVMTLWNEIHKSLIAHLKVVLFEKGCLKEAESVIESLLYSVRLAGEASHRAGLESVRSNMMRGSPIITRVVKQNDK